MELTSGYLLIPNKSIICFYFLIQPFYSFSQYGELEIPDRSIAEHPLLKPVTENSLRIQMQEDALLDTLIAIINNTKNPNELRRGAVFELGHCISNPKAAIFLTLNIGLKINLPPLYVVGDDRILRTPCYSTLLSLNSWDLISTVFIVLREKDLVEKEIWLFYGILRSIGKPMLKNILEYHLVRTNETGKKNIIALLNFMN